MTAKYLVVCHWDSNTDLRKPNRCCLWDFNNNLCHRTSLSCFLSTCTFLHIVVLSFLSHGKIEQLEWNTNFLFGVKRKNFTKKILFPKLKIKLVVHKLWFCFLNSCKTTPIFSCYNASSHYQRNMMDKNIFRLNPELVKGKSIKWLNFLAT